MKNLVFFHLLFVLSYFHTNLLFSQDLISTNNGKTIIGDIQKIGPDTVFVLMDYKGKKNKSFILKDKILSLEIKILKELEATLDTSDYTIRLVDQTQYRGKISGIDSFKIFFRDKISGDIMINGEDIADFSKAIGIHYYQITLKDGTEIFGKMVKQDANEMELLTTSIGTVKIKLENIKEMIEIENTKQTDKGYWLPNPNETRYLFGPSGYNLKKGEGYYQNTYVLVNMANYGISDYFSIGGGYVLLSNLGNATTAFITPKFGFPVGEKFQLGVGVIAGIIGGEGSGGILYSVGTYGNKEHNLTAGLGYGFLEGEFSKKPVITFSGMTRIGRKLAFVSENWIIPTTEDTFGIFSYGLRLLGPKMSWDFAFLNNFEIIQAIPIGIPYVDFVFKF